MQHLKSLVLLGAALWVGAPFLAAANQPAGTPETDRIDEIAHLAFTGSPLAGVPIVQLTTGSHWRRDYLYLDRGGANAVTIVDVTNAAAPEAIGQMDFPKQEASGQVTAVVGTAALVASPASSQAFAQTARPIPQTITIMSFADPEHPKVERQYNGVTAMLKDPARGLIYLANADGLWVLKMDPATDRAQQEQYDKYLLYTR